MTNINVSANTKPETKHCVELTVDELETVSGGTHKASGHSTGGMFLVFTFKLVAVKTI